MADINVEEILKKLSLAEKVSLLAGQHQEDTIVYEVFKLITSQVSTSGTQSLFLNMEFHLFASPMDPTV